MTIVEIEEALANIIIERENACKKKIISLTDKYQNEKKALMIECGMYSLCLRAGLVYNNLSNREKTIALKKMRFPNHLNKYSSLSEYFSNANDEEKLRLTAALYGEVWIEDQILGSYQTELAEAKKNKDAKRSFEFKIKVKVVESVLSEWKNWRVKNGIYPEFPGR